MIGLDVTKVEVNWQYEDYIFGKQAHCPFDYN